MVSHLPLLGGSASRAPFRTSYCTTTYPLASPPHSTYACNTRARVAQSIYYELYGTHRARARRSTLRPTIPRTARLPCGNCIISRKLSRSTRVHACMHARETLRFLRFLESSLKCRKARGFFYFCRREVRASSVRSVRSYTLVPRNRK